MHAKVVPNKEVTTLLGLADLEESHVEFSEFCDCHVLVITGTPITLFFQTDYCNKASVNGK